MFSFEYNWEINQLKNKKKTLNAFKDTPKPVIIMTSSFILLQWNANPLEE